MLYSLALLMDRLGITDECRGKHQVCALANLKD